MKTPYVTFFSQVDHETRGYDIREDVIMERTIQGQTVCLVACSQEYATREEIMLYRIEVLHGRGDGRHGLLIAHAVFYRLAQAIAAFNAACKGKLPVAIDCTQLYVVGDTVVYRSDPYGSVYQITAAIPDNREDFWRYHLQNVADRHDCRDEFQRDIMPKEQ